MPVLKVFFDNFEKEVLKSEEPVLVYFMSEDCAPCKLYGPILDELADEQSGQIRIVKINVRESPDIRVKYGVAFFPFFLAMKNGTILRHGYIDGVNSQDDASTKKSVFIDWMAEAIKNPVTPAPTPETLQELAKKEKADLLQIVDDETAKRLAEVFRQIEEDAAACVNGRCAVKDKPSSPKP